MYLNMSFNGALGGILPASLATSGIFNAQVRVQALLLLHAAVNLQYEGNSSPRSCLGSVLP